MERIRRTGAASGNGVALATRRRRGRNPSDEEDKLEENSELRFGKRPKKDLYGLTIAHLSASADPLNKRKRAQDSQPSGQCVEAHESTEGLKADDDVAPSSAPHHRKHVKCTTQSKEDKFFIDFSVVPRKPRSSILLSSRLTSTTRKQPDFCTIQLQSPGTMLNGSSSPDGSLPHILRKRSASHVPAVSDQEAEVAEALFVLSRSTPSRSGVLDSKLEAKLGMEAKRASSSATSQCFVGAPASSGPVFPNAVLKGKPPQVFAEKKERKSSRVSSPSALVHSSVGETELGSALQRAHSLAGEERSFPSETLNFKIPAGSPDPVPRWPCHMKKKTLRGLEEQGDDYSGAKIIKGGAQDTDMELREPEVCVTKRISTSTQEKTVEGFGNHEEALTKSHLSSRSDTAHDCNGRISMSKIDFMTSSTFGKLEAFHEIGGELSTEGLNAKNVYLKSKDGVYGRIQGSNEEEFEEQKAQPSVRRLQHREVKEEDHSPKSSLNRKNNDTGNSSVSSCFSSLSSTAVSRHAPNGLAGWISGFSQLGYHGSAATSWAATSSLSIDMNTAHPAMQVPHAAIFSLLPKMKSCATHVYIAHYIHCEQRAAQHSLWSAAFCRATTYNLNVPPVKQYDNDGPREAYTGFTQQKAQTHETEPSVACNVSQSSMPSSSGSTHGSGVSGITSASNLPTSSRAYSATSASVVTASGHDMSAQAQYLQKLMRQSGLASFPCPMNGPSGQTAQFFNGPFFQPHLFSHRRPLAQQTANVLPVHKLQQAKGAPISAVEHQHKLAILQSPSQSQQQPQKVVGTSACESSAHSERESKDLSLMATSGVGYIDKFQQASPSMSSGQQQHLSFQNTLSSTGHQLERFDQSFSSTSAVIGMSEQPVGTRSLGLLSAASKSAVECNGLLPGSDKRSHAALSVNDNSFTLKGQDCIEVKRVTTKQGGAYFDLPKAGNQSCKLAALLVDEGLSPASQEVSTVPEVKMGGNCVCNSMLGGVLTCSKSERDSDTWHEAAETEKTLLQTSLQG